MSAQPSPVDVDAQAGFEVTDEDDLPFSQIANEFWDEHARALTSAEIALYGLLRRFKGSNSSAWPSVDTLATRLSWGVSTVWRTLAGLESKGFITRKRRLGKPSLLTFRSLRTLKNESSELSNSRVKALKNERQKKKNKEEEQVKKSESSVEDSSWWPADAGPQSLPTDQPPAAPASTTGRRKTTVPRPRRTQAPTEVSPPVVKKVTTKPQDLIYEAIVLALYARTYQEMKDEGTLTKTAQDAVGMAANEIRKTATPELVALCAEWFRKKFPGLTLTAHCFRKYWSDFIVEQKDDRPPTPEEYIALMHAHRQREDELERRRDLARARKVAV